MNNSIKKNYIYNLMYEILAIITPMITAPYAARVLGAQGVGANAYVGSFVSYFAIFAVTGTTTYGKRKIAENQQNIENRSRDFWEIFLFRTICTLIVFGAYLVFIFNFLPQYRILFYLQILSIFSYIFDISWYFQGMENFKLTAIRNAIIKIVATVLLFVCIKSPDDLPMYVFINCGSTLLVNMTMWGYMKKEVTAVKLSSLNLKQHFKPIMGLFIPVIAIQIYTVLDISMLGAFSSETQVAYYEQAERIIKIVRAVINSFVSVLLPRITVYYINNDIEEMENCINKAQRYVLMLALPMMIGCMMIANTFMPWFLGSEFASSGNVLALLSVLFLVQPYGNLAGTILIALGEQKKYSTTICIAAITNFVLNLTFLTVFDMGAVGVSLATVIAESLIVIINSFHLKEYMGISSFMKNVYRYLPPCVVMGAVIMILKYFIATGTVFLFTSVFCGIVIYFAILYIRKDDMFMSFIDSILVKLKIKK